MNKFNGTPKLKLPKKNFLAMSIVELISVGFYY